MPNDSPLTTEPAPADSSRNSMLPSGSEQTSAGAEAEPFPVLSWSVFRARENPRRTIFAVVFILAVVVFVALSYDAVMALLAVLVFALTLNSYFLPTTYTFDRNGITTDKLFFRYSRRWDEFRSYIRTTGGVVISPFRHWTYLDNFRGLHLLLPPDPAPVLKYLADRLPEKRRPGKTRTGQQPESDRQSKG